MLQKVFLADFGGVFNIIKKGPMWLNMHLVPPGGMSFELPGMCSSEIFFLPGRDFLGVTSLDNDHVTMWMLIDRVFRATFDER